MKEIYCEQCKKNYKINYYYTHKNKSKKHIKNSRTTTELFNNENNDNTTRNTKVFLLDLKQKIDDFLSNL